MEGKAPDRPIDLVAKATKARVLAAFVVGLTLVSLLWLAFTTGALAAGVGLHDPDTCWLLALGRYICDRQALPNTDPFSYTFVSQGQPFIVYQWLSAVIYFSIWKLVRLKGLLLIHAVIICVAFIALPLALLRRMRAPYRTGIPILVLTLISASFRFLVKAETLSFLLLMSWLAILGSWRASKDIVGAVKNGAAWKMADIALVAALGIIMSLWANLHITFVLGFVALALLLFCEWLPFLRQPGQIVFKVRPLLLGVFVALLGSMLNPKGWLLLAYLPTIFLSPTNKYVDEMQPVLLDDFGIASMQVFLFPFLALILVAILLQIRYVRLARSRAVPWNQVGLFSPALIAFAVVLGFSAKRAIPFAAIFLFCECAFLMQAVDQQNSTSIKEYFERAMKACLGKGWPIVFGLIVLLSLHGADRTLSAEPPSLPQNSQVITVPAYALEYLAKHKQEGRQLNDAQYGDLLDWYLPYVMPVFIDTRFAMFGGKLVHDYHVITTCSSGFEKLLKDYEFDWAFFPLASPVADYLRTNSEWVELYRDKSASIFRRRQLKQ